MTRQKLQTQFLLTTDYLPRWDQKVVSAAVVCYEEQRLQRPYQQQQQCGDRVGRQPTIPLPWAVLLRFQLVGGQRLFQRLSTRTSRGRQPSHGQGLLRHTLVLLRRSLCSGSASEPRREAVLVRPSEAQRTRPTPTHGWAPVPSLADGFKES
ncbi:hypothetical protein E2C01_047442 [Portunus trituberculatus]|uniref:Uncharacterized protein n=1 Tax=Portunus trituberculatus TaxID=210409 RepID=A0A5B7G7L6_PORTR|nr:hypothetical protein [Portunus trituberculatus]